jgi:hypothetical protein
VYILRYTQNVVVLTLVCSNVSKVTLHFFIGKIISFIW